jgi:hypothetical protein
MNKLEILRRRIIKKFNNWRYSGWNIPFEISYRDLDEKIRNFNNNLDGIIPPPSDCKKVLSEFDYEDRHYVIYIKK